MQCPVCKETSLVMTERQGIEIDYCPRCRGVWLDRGELDKIIERTTSEGQRVQEHDLRSREQRGYRDYEDNKDYGKGWKKKRRGFLGELFDFD